MAKESIDKLLVDAVWVDLGILKLGSRREVKMKEDAGEHVNSVASKSAAAAAATSSE